MLAEAPSLFQPWYAPPSFMSLFRPLALGLLTVLAAVPGLSQPVARQTVVATVDGELGVTVADLQARAERAFYRGVLQRPARYSAALQEATLDRLKGLDFFRLGYDEDPGFVRYLGPRFTEELLVAYYERQYETPYLNEESIRDQYEAMGNVVFYRQIVLRKPPGADASVLEAIRGTVDEIRRQLNAGVPVEDLVSRYSEDEPSVLRGGLMPPVTWDQSTGSALNAVVFQLEPGEVVSLETSNSFIVAVGDHIEERALPEFASVYDQIVESLRGRYAEQANEAYYEERQALVDSASVQWNRDALAQIVEWSRTPGFFERDYPQLIRENLAANGDAVVFTDSVGELHMSDLTRLLGEVLRVSGAGDRSEEFVQDFLLEAVRADRMVALAEDLGLRDELLQPDTPSPIVASGFAGYYDQRLIEAKIPDTTEAALRSFYQAHDDSLFYQLATVYTEVIVRADEGEIETLWEQSQEGVPFDELSHRRQIRSFERTRDGAIVTRFNSEPPYLGEAAFGLEPGDVAGPFSYVDSTQGRLHAIVHVTRRLDERQLNFEEVRDRVAEAFIEHHRARLEREVEADLRNRYTVTVDERAMNVLMNGPQ